MPDVVGLFMLVLGGAGLLVKFIGLLHLTTQVGVDAQSLGLRVTLEVRGALALSGVLLRADAHEGLPVRVLAAHDVSSRREHVLLLHLAVLTI